MAQTDLENQEWVEVNPMDDDSEIIKLREGEEITGILLDKYPSKKYPGHQIYKIKPKDGVSKVIIGTTVLDNKMTYVEINDVIRIIRDKDQKNDTGRFYQVYRVLKKQEGQG